MNKELIAVCIFGSLAIFAGVIILIFGETGSGIGGTVYKFRGLERLYGLYPIIIGGFIIFAFRVKHSKDKDDD